MQEKSRYKVWLSAGWSIMSKLEPVSLNTVSEPIHMTGLPLDKLPPDTPNYLTDLTYNRILDNLSAGQSVSSTLLEFGCSKVTVGRVMRWFLKDEGRKKEFLLAKEVGSEVMAEEMVDIADGKMDNKDEDIMLRALRVKTRGTIIAQNNKSRFGKEATVKVNVDLQKALEDASKRAKEAENIEVIDVDFEES